MRNTNRKRVLLVSGSVILLCMAIIVGTTWALFTDVENVENHLQAGKLNLTLTRTKLSGLALDASTGYLVDFEDLQQVGFTDTTTEENNVFQITPKAEPQITYDTKVVPGTKYVATMQISNNKTNSDTAFGYWVEIDYDETASNADFAKQVEVIVTPKGRTGIKATAEAGLKVGNDGQPIAVVAKGETAEFTVSVEFKNVTNSENDKAQGKNVEFDLIVHAVQAQNP